MVPGLERFRRLADVALVATLVLTGIGGLVRATNSGLGCLDEWPLCHGGWIAPANAHSIIEYAHRLAAAVVVGFMIALVVFARRWMRAEPRFFKLALGAFGVVLFQAAIGAAVVKSDLHVAVVTAHFMAALALNGLVAVIAASAHVHGRPPATGVQKKVASLAFGAVVALLPLLVVGAYVRERGAGLAFADWPLMGGRLIPEFTSSAVTLHFVHRILVVLVLGHLIGLTLRARKDARRGVRLLALTGFGLFIAQAFVGAANVWTDLTPVTVLAHATLAFVTWASYVALAVVSRRGRVGSAQTGSFDRGGTTAPPRTPPAVGDRRGATLFDSVGSYVRLTKPRIITQLLVTTVPAMVVAERGMPKLWLIGATLLGGTMTAGSANALNQYLEQDIDEKMNRTKGRPLPSHAVSSVGALMFAALLGVGGFVFLWSVVNLLSGLLAVAALVFYVAVYTLLLKRNTPQNIVIGGAAGAVPVLVGWAAVTNTVAAPAWVMFAIIFLWTPPHFWALAIKYRDDYAAAGVPMMPVVRSESSTTTQIFVYSVVLVASTLLLSPVGGLGALYAVTAAALGAGFLYRATQLRLQPSPQTAYKLFKYSITYLTVLFAAIAVDGLVW